MSGRPRPSCDRLPRDAVGVGRRIDRDERRRPSASDGLLHLAIGLTYLYGGLAIWDHEPANRTGRLMTLVGLTWFIGTLDRPGSRSSARSRWRSRTHLDVILRRPRARLSERQARDARRSGRRRDPGGRRHRPQRPLLDEPHDHRRQEHRPVRRAGARDDDDGRHRPPLVDRTAARATGSWRPSSWPASSS